MRGHPNNDVSLNVNDQAWQGWESVRVTRGIERFPGDFEVTLTETTKPHQQQRGFIHLQGPVINPGDGVIVYAGDDALITGYVDRYAISITPDSHEVTISGRGKCQDLVDCAAKISTYQINNTSVLDLAKAVTKDFKNVSVISNLGPLPLVQQFGIVLSESPFEILERVARYLAFLLIEDTNGNLVLDVAGGGGTHSSGFVQGVNVQAASATFSLDGRFSEYEALYQAVDPLSDLSRALNVAAGSGNTIAGGTFNDPGVTRYRPRLIISEQGFASDQVAKTRASWECARRYGRSQAVTVTVDSWRDNAGKLWTPNTLATLRLPHLKLPDPVQWLIGEVTYIRNLQQGTIAQVTLMPIEAFQPEPDILYTFDLRIWQETNPGQPIPGPVPR